MLQLLQQLMLLLHLLFLWLQLQLLLFYHTFSISLFFVFSQCLSFAIICCFFCRSLNILVYFLHKLVSSFTLCHTFKQCCNKILQFSKVTTFNCLYYTTNSSSITTKIVQIINCTYIIIRFISNLTCFFQTVCVRYLFAIFSCFAISNSYLYFIDCFSSFVCVLF